MKKLIFMKTTLKLLGTCLATLVLASCGSNPDNDCSIGNVVIDCENAEIYNHFVAKEQDINASFQKGAKKLTPNEEEQLRIDLVEYYKNHKEDLQTVYLKIKDSVFGARDPLSVYEMRSEELSYFKERAEERKKAKKFTETLNIRAYEVDTSFYEGQDKLPYLVYEIHNTSDSTISGVVVNKVIEKDGEIIMPNSPTHYLLSEDMILPKEKGKSVVRPDEKLVLTFEILEGVKIKPEILSYSFKND